jgi:hypothetical protein
MKLTPSHSIHPVTGHLGRGCVSHLPAPGCLPDGPADLVQPCFPLLDLLTGSRDVTPDRRNPTAGHRRSRLGVVRK